MRLGRINQTANPLMEGDVVEIYHTYEDKTVLGNRVTAVRVLNSSNPYVETRGIELIATYKITVLDIRCN